MQPLQIVDNIYDVGVQDWAVRDFHGYKTERGATYNAYLIMDEKITLVDTVKAPFAEELLRNISQVTPLESVDYIVINHVEPDHSGAMPALAKACPNAKFIISMAGKNEAIQHYGDIFDFMVVKDGATLNIGKRNLTFAMMTMLHWPDNMATYCAEEKILFSNDAFGQHYATSKRFDDEVDQGELFYEAQKYFANILWPYAKLIGKALAKLGGLDIKLLAPSHGVIWRSGIADILDCYGKWGQGVCDGSLIIAYDSMWGGTEKLARAIARGAQRAGIVVKVFKLSQTPNSTVAAELFTASGLLVGSPTLNSGMMPSMGSFLTYIKGLAPVGKKAASFGTFGWAGGAQKDMDEMLGKFVPEVLPGYQCKWTPQAVNLDAAEQFGYDFAQELLEKGQNGEGCQC
ncbi:FprA family A-type flavoprotein [uncultured Phascolarctobacterium sp.]|uniref:FprA family A-type flavoprotein n=1 Tax=uncultured Phascolarctobacterium sp. TaxID=512296 RepID=UPI0025FA43A3|nr:FprA family A-type flavoprotein [uncultured Phascolarctobacterium sp.]